MKRDALPVAAISSATPEYARREWLQFGAVLCVLWIWILAWYASTGMAMVQIWRRSDTFAHGFVVLPISLWLVWRMREQLAQTRLKPAWWPLPLLALAGFGWLLGELASVNALTQFALTSLLVLTVVAALGNDVARQLMFPLAFLFFAVPIGEFMLPRLMEWTADFTVLGLRLSGIPVFREGQRFVIPSGSWSVVEACSGVRYLIASAMVGTLFAYLTYRSLKRRLLFVAVAIAVPIVANWLRAYIIVMLGHLSDNKIAAGVDHLIYGWIFFGVVIGIMLWIGALWREDVADSPGSVLQVEKVEPTARGRSVVVFAAIAAIAVVWKIGYWAIERSDAAASPQIAPIALSDGWVSTDSVPEWRPQFENPSTELRQAFRHGGQAVGLYVGYYRNQDYNSKLVSSTNVLVRSDDPKWALTANGNRTIDLNGEPVAVRTANLRSSLGGERMFVWQWYWINGRITASDHRAKAYTAVSRLQGNGDDSAVIILYTTEQDSGAGVATLQKFLTAAAPAIESRLRQARDAR